MLDDLTAKTRFLVGIAVLCSPFLLSTSVKAADLGMTPTHVYGLWTSINTLLIRLAEIDTDESGVHSRLSAVSLLTHEAKHPADVIEQVVVFREKANRLMKRVGLPPIAKEHRAVDAQITPSDVFLDSGHVLDGLVLLYVSKTDADDYISGFYRNQKFSRKSPNEVYALVQQANERLDLLNH